VREDGEFYIAQVDYKKALECGGDSVKKHLIFSKMNEIGLKIKN